MFKNEVKYVIDNLQNTGLVDKGLIQFTGSDLLLAYEAGRDEVIDKVSELLQSLNNE